MFGIESKQYCTQESLMCSQNIILNIRTLKYFKSQVKSHNLTGLKVNLTSKIRLYKKNWSHLITFGYTKNLIRPKWSEYIESLTKKTPHLVDFHAYRAVYQSIQCDFNWVHVHFLTLLKVTYQNSEGFQKNIS